MADIDQRQKYERILEIQKLGRELVRKTGNPIKFIIERSYYIKEDGNGKH